MDILNISKEIFNNIQQTAPVVHNISNYITATDCANITLACGGSPTMADDPEEVAEVASACHASVINMGNTGGYFEDTMIRTGLANNAASHPLILDPVGAGGSARRNAVLNHLMKRLHFSIIRGNISEIKYIATHEASAKGVDASENDLASESNIQDIASWAKSLSARLGSVIVISGPIDVVASAGSAYLIRNGHPMMAQVTGTGCMLSSVLGVFAAANPDHLAEAAAVAVSAYGYAGELAYNKTVKTQGGTGSLRTFLIDYMSIMDAGLWEQGARITYVKPSADTLTQKGEK